LLQKIFKKKTAKVKSTYHHTNYIPVFVYSEYSTLLTNAFYQHFSHKVRIIIHQHQNLLPRV